MKYNKNTLFGAILMMVALFAIGAVIAYTVTVSDQGISQDSKSFYPDTNCTVDATGKGDSTTLSGCVSNGGHVYVRDGDYYVNSQISVPSNTRIEFSPGATVYGNFTGDYGVLKIGAGVSNVNIDGYTCDLLDKGHRCLWIFQATDWHVSHVDFSGDYSTSTPNRVFFHIQGSNGTFDHVMIQGYDSAGTSNYTGLGIGMTNYVENVQGDHITLLDTDDSCFSIGGGIANAVSNVQIDGVTCISDPNTNQGGYGIDLFGAYDDVMITNVYVEGKANDCVMLQTSGSYWGDRVMLDNVFCKDIQGEGLHVKINNTDGVGQFSNFWLVNVGLDGGASTDCVEHEYGDDVVFNNINCVGFQGGGLTYRTKPQYQQRIWMLDNNVTGVEQFNATTGSFSTLTVAGASALTTASSLDDTQITDYTGILYLDKSAILGSAALEAYGEYANIKMPDSANSQVFGTVVIPNNVESVNSIDAYVFGEGTGDVMQKFEVTAAAVGEALNTHRDTNAFAAYTIGTSSQIYKISYTEAFLTNLNPGDVVGVEFYRSGGDGSDTLTADLDIIALAMNVTYKQ